MRASVVLLAACGRVGFGAQPDAADTSGLVAYYPMDDDPSGGAIASPQRPATCTTCPTPTTGVRGGGYHFDGTQGFGIGALLDGDYTVSVWSRFELATTSDDDGLPLVARATSTTSEFDAFNLLSFEGKLTFESTVDNSDTAYLQASSDLALNAWHHAAASWDGTTKRLYADGALVAQADATIFATSQPVTVGEDVDNGVPRFFLVGAMDELRIYDRALSDAEIQLLSAP